MRSLVLNLLALCVCMLDSKAQKATKNQLSTQDILATLNTQPVLLPDSGKPNQPSNSMPQPVLNVQPLQERQVNGDDVMSSLRAACGALKQFINRSEFVKQRMSMMSPYLMPWLYSQQLGMATECGHSSYSNALKIFATACNVFETCPLPTPVMDLETMSPSFLTNFQMPFEFAQGFGMPMSPLVARPIDIPMSPGSPMESRPIGVPRSQVSPMVARPIAMPMSPVSPMMASPTPVKPAASSQIALTLKEALPKQVRIVQRRRNQMPRQTQTTRQPTKPAPSKQAPVPMVLNTPAVPRQTMPVQTVASIPATQKQVPVAQAMFPFRIPIPSMASMYPVWFYRLRQMPNMVRSASVRRSRQPVTTPNPDHDHSD